MACIPIQRMRFTLCKNVKYSGLCTHISIAFSNTLSINHIFNPFAKNGQKSQVWKGGGSWCDKHWYYLYIISILSRYYLDIIYCFISILSVILSTILSIYYLFYLFYLFYLHIVYIIFILSLLSLYYFCIICFIFFICVLSWYYLYYLHIIFIIFILSLY